MSLGSGIRKKLVLDPGSRGQKGTGSRIRIRNTEICYETILFNYSQMSQIIILNEVFSCWSKLMKKKNNMFVDSKVSTILILLLSPKKLT